MNSRRLAKISQAIREVVSTTILFELRDPRIQNVTVTSVETAEDLRSAKIKISVMGDEKAESLCLKGLTSSRGFLQSKIAKRIDTRYTPVLTFEIDHGIKKSLEAARILREELGDLSESAELDQPSDSEAEVEFADDPLMKSTEEPQP